MLFRSLNGSKILSYGAPNSIELQYIKRAFNDIVNTVKKNLPKAIFSLGSERATRITSLPILDLKTEYGKETKQVAGVILGKYDFSYNDAKKQKQAIYNALNLPDPYGN